MRDSDSWWAIDAATGDVKAKIKTEHGQNYTDHPILGIGPHNTWMSRDGSRVYMSILTVPWIYIADTKTNQVIGKAGPFGKGIRPFAVSEDEKYIYANVDWLLGFEVAEGIGCGSLDARDRALVDLCDHAVFHARGAPSNLAS